mmetsp:Transcript_2285/g.4772  ORF Transcript_2285/g.4772 Transcript_2285/m.4772 type:complete len:218 (-) Transcript_2285:53-706(-)
MKGSTGPRVEFCLVCASDGHTVRSKFARVAPLRFTFPECLIPLDSPSSPGAFPSFSRSVHSHKRCLRRRACLGRVANPRSLGMASNTSLLEAKDNFHRCLATVFVVADLALKDMDTIINGHRHSKSHALLIEKPEGITGYGWGEAVGLSKNRAQLHPPMLVQLHPQGSAISSNTESTGSTCYSTNSPWIEEHEQHSGNKVTREDHVMRRIHVDRRGF